MNMFVYFYFYGVYAVSPGPTTWSHSTRENLTLHYISAYQVHLCYILLGNHGNHHNAWTRFKKYVFKLKTSSLSALLLRWFQTLASSQNLKSHCVSKRIWSCSGTNFRFHNSLILFLIISAWSDSVQWFSLILIIILGVWKFIREDFGSLGIFG